MATRSEFEDWLQHPITVDLRKQIAKDILNMQEMLIEVEEYDLRHLQGRVKASINLVNVSYEDLYEGGSV
jgi:hypothetical protein